MNTFFLGTKKQMTQLFTDDGRAYPATVLEVAPAYVTQVKEKEKDGYDALQVGTGIRAGKNIGKAVLGATATARKSASLPAEKGFRFLKEYRLREAGEVALGSEVSLEGLSEGTKVHVSAISKGKGFQGVVKRHGFAGGPRTHGQKHSERSPGSIGAQGPQRVFKNTRMAGRMGGTRTTVKNLKVLKVDTEKNLLYLKGAVPGPTGSFVEIRVA